MKLKSLFLSTVAMSAIVSKAQLFLDYTLFDQAPELLNPSYVGGDSVLELNSANTVADFNYLTNEYSIVESNNMLQTMIGEKNGIGVMYGKEIFDDSYNYNTISLLYSRQLPILKESIYIGGQFNYSFGEIRAFYEDCPVGVEEFGTMIDHNFWSANVGISYQTERLNVGYALQYQSENNYRIGWWDATRNMHHIVNADYVVIAKNKFQLKALAGYLKETESSSTMLFGINAKYHRFNLACIYDFSSNLYFRSGFETQKLNLNLTYGITTYDRELVSSQNTTIQLMVGYKLYTNTSR